MEVISGGMRYVFPEKIDTTKPDNWKGFGGRKFTVHLHDGRVFKTDDLYWDFSMKHGARSDSGSIYEGWGPVDDSQRLAWRFHENIGQSFFEKVTNE